MDIWFANGAEGIEAVTAESDMALFNLEAVAYGVDSRDDAINAC